MQNTTPTTAEQLARCISEGIDMNQKLVVIIGGSSGIGFEIARQTSALGARLTIVGRDQVKLAASAKKLGGTVKAAVLDAHDDAAQEEFFSKLVAVDHLVSMVGDSMAGGFLTTTPETMRHVLHSKFWSNWLIGKHAAPKVRAGGSITFTAGTGGRAQEISASYVANLGIGALVQGLASELAPRVRVNAVSPTFMGKRTPFWKDMPPKELKKTIAGFTESVPLKRLATVEEVASAYVYLMGNDFITGQVLTVDGGVMLRK
jgi:NAD(P)-dependent dehydrogenase (short-subunit alcohol dehydrogenase family)